MKFFLYTYSEPARIVGFEFKKGAIIVGIGRFTNQKRAPLGFKNWFRLVRLKGWTCHFQECPRAFKPVKAPKQINEIFIDLL